MTLSTASPGRPFGKQLLLAVWVFCFASMMIGASLYLPAQSGVLMGRKGAEVTWAWMMLQAVGDSKAYDPGFERACFAGSKLAVALLWGAPFYLLLALLPGIRWVARTVSLLLLMIWGHAYLVAVSDLAVSHHVQLREGYYLLALGATTLVAAVFLVPTVRVGRPTAVTSKAPSAAVGTAEPAPPPSDRSADN